MADYIRREDALFALRKAERGGSMTALTRLERAYAEIREMPAADVAPVVRCKDCAKHYIVLGRDMCARNAQGSEGHWIGLSATVPDGFCHSGSTQMSGLRFESMGGHAAEDAGDLCTAADRPLRRCGRQLPFTRGAMERRSTAAGRIRAASCASTARRRRGAMTS